MNQKQTESGSALVYILIAIALLALLTVTFMEPSSQQTQSQNSFKTVSSLQSQIDFIRSAVQECVLTYIEPGGDIGIPNATGQEEEGANKRYPIDPRSTYLTDPVVGGDPLVQDIRCPGNPGDDPDHGNIFGGSTGKFLPPAPDLFEDWRWYNESDGVFFWTYTTKSDAFVQTAIDKIDESFSTCEVDVSTAGDAITSDGALECPANATCLRVWIIADNVAGGGDPEDGSSDAAIATYTDGSGCP